MMILTPTIIAGQFAVGAQQAAPLRAALLLCKSGRSKQRPYGKRARKYIQKSIKEDVYARDQK